MSTTQTLSFIFTLSTLWVNFLCCYLPSTYSAQAIVLQHNLLNKKCVLLDLAKFRQFGNISKVFANNFDVVLLVLGTILNTFWTKNSIWLIFIAVNGQILNKQYSHLVTLRYIPISGTWSPAVLIRARERRDVVVVFFTWTKTPQNLLRASRRRGPRQNRPLEQNLKHFFLSVVFSSRVIFVTCLSTRFPTATDTMNWVR